MTPILGRASIEPILTKLKKMLGKEPHEDIDIHFKPQRGNMFPLKVRYMKDLDFWFATDVGEGKGKVWSPFGVGHLNKNQTVGARLEINFSPDSSAYDVAGLLARGTDGKIYLLHNGRIGGGVKGVGQSAFVGFSNAERREIEVEGKIRTYLMVGCLSDPGFSASLSNFVHSVDAFKRSIRANEPDQIKVAGHPRNSNGSGTRNPIDLQTNEYAELKSYDLPARTVSGGNKHSLVFSALKKELEYLNPRRDFYRDLFIRGAKGQITHLFEIKSSPSLQAVYTAIGQLMLRSVEDKATCIIVLPDETNKELIKDLAKLKIDIVTFSFDTNNQVHFKGLKNIINA